MSPSMLVGQLIIMRRIADKWHKIQHTLKTYLNQPFKTEWEGY